MSESTGSMSAVLEPAITGDDDDTKGPSDKL